LLTCGHQCIGLCGERCPSVCRVCEPHDSCFDILFGNEENPNSMFYQCNCNHIFEVKGLDTYFTQNEGSVQMLKCPLCKAILTNESRYINVIKMKIKDLSKVKEKIIEMSTKDEYLVMNKQLIQYIQQLNVSNRLHKINNYNNGYYKGINSLKDSKAFIEKFNENSIKAKSVCTYRLLSLFRFFIAIETLYRMVDDSNNNNMNGVNSVNYSMISYNGYPVYSSYNNYNNIKTIEGMDLFKANYNVIRKYFETYEEYSKNFLDMLTIKIKNLFTYVKIIFDHPDQIRVSKGLSWFSRKPCMQYLLETKFYELDIDNISKQFIEYDINIINMIKGLGTKWYKCPNGHLYVVGECGGPMESGRCPECGARIGGRDHNPNAGNALVNNFEREFRGANANYNLFSD
jgi:hypothetical protein